MRTCNKLIEQELLATQPLAVVRPGWREYNVGTAKLAVSSNGDIQDRKTGKFMRVFRGKCGYLVTSIEGILLNVHQIVANAWH